MPPRLTLNCRSKHLADSMTKAAAHIIGFDLAPGGKSECFGHILARADERTADGYAVRHDIEERNREFAWRQTD